MLLGCDFLNPHSSSKLRHNLFEGATMKVSLDLPWPLAKLSLPVAEWIGECTKESLLSDATAGFTVFVFLVPQGMAYSLLAGMPPIYGLYSAIVPSYVYALFGTSRQLSIGPMAITSLLLSVAIDKYEFPQESDEYILLVMNLSLMVGIVVCLIGLLRLGSLVNLIGECVLSGFLTASAVVILLNQVKYILGLNVPQYDYTYQTIQYLLVNAKNTNLAALSIGVLSIAALYGTKRWIASDSKPAPTDGYILRTQRALASVSNLIAILVSPAIAYYLISHGYELDIVGTVPSGLKAPGFQFVGVEIFLGFLPAALAIAFVAFTGNWAVATKYAAKHHYEVDATQELIAAGLATLVGVFFNCFAVSGGLARSAVNAESGARTPLSGVVSATLMIVAVQFCTGMFYFIPMSTLGAVIIVSVLSMIDFETMYAAHRTHPKDSAVMVVTCLVTFFVGVTFGLFVGIGISLGLVVYDAAYPGTHVLGRLPVTRDDTTTDAGAQFREVARFEKAEQCPSVLIMRMEAPLFFANCAYFKETVLQAAAGTLPASDSFADRSGTGTYAAGECRETVHTVIVDASCWTDLDLVSTKTLKELREKLTSKQVVLLISGAMGQVHEKLYSAQFAGHFVAYSIEDALRVGPLAHAERVHALPVHSAVQEVELTDSRSSDRLLPLSTAHGITSNGNKKPVMYGSVDKSDNL